MERVSESILNKVRQEAQSVVDEAKEKAQAERERAKAEQEVRFQEEKRKMLGEAEDEAARIMAQASIKSRQKLSTMKSEVITKTIDMIKQELSKRSGDNRSVLNLIKEAMDGLNADKARIYVLPKEANMVKRSLEENKELGGKVVEVKEGDFLGGVIAEDVDGKVRIDNTYEARLEMLLPKLLPEVGKELFSET